MKPPAVILYGLLYCFCGSVLFWFPDAVWHRIRGDGFAGIDALLLTLLLPAIVLLALRVFLLQRWRGLSPLPIAGFMILGILVTGPLWMAIRGRFRGVEALSWHDVLV